MPPIVHAFCDDALADHDAVELARRIRTGELQAREVVDAAIARARRVAPVLNPIALECFARAAEAAAQPRTGAFAGVPTFLKDTISLSGLPTCYGSLALADVRPARTDDAVAGLFLAQGFVVLGKSTLPEMGFNATTEPAGASPTRNPWSTEHSPGGSSGGSAALVASGVVPLAHGNDGGGSLRIPAACCGLFALKPSLGRLPMTEAARKMPIGIVCEGVLTRTVRDTAHFYAAAEGPYRHPKLPPVGLVEGPAGRRLRVGLLLDSTAIEHVHVSDRACSSRPLSAASRFSGKRGRRTTPCTTQRPPSRRRGSPGSRRRCCSRPARRIRLRVPGKASAGDCTPP